MKNVLRSAIFFFSAVLLVGAHSAFAIDLQLGFPGPLGDETGIPGIIQNIYVVALGLAGALALGSIIYGAVEYSLSKGNPSKLSDAWDRILQAFIGVLLLVGAGTLLSIINPGLLNLQLPDLGRVADTKFVAVDLPDPTPKEADEIGTIIATQQNNPVYKKITGGACAPIDARDRLECSPAYLDEYAARNDCRYKGQAWNGTFMSVVCRKESGGNPLSQSGTDRCYNNGSNGEAGISFSIGLFQINLINERNNPKGFPECAGALVPFSTQRGQFRACSGGDASLGTCLRACRPAGTKMYCPLRNCGIKDANKYQACINAVAIPERNIARACQLFKLQGYSAWSASASKVRACGVSI